MAATAAETSPVSNATSPASRSSSPSPSVDASLSIDAVPKSERSVSTPASSISGGEGCEPQLSISNRSRNSRLSDGSATVVRRRGYIRPQGTVSADSAKNRDSVMSLGSIAHMQYYFARTGLLDGKGAQLAREDDRKKKGFLRKGREMGGLNEPSNIEASMRSMSGSELDRANVYLDDSYASSYAASDSGLDLSISESPTEAEFGELWDPSDPTMLPPTVSTYKVKPEVTEPLPDMPVLRRELKEALQDACKALEESQNKPASADTAAATASSAYHEIQGLHILDIITLAIRAAKNYYTSHVNPQKLFALKPERELRKDLYNTLDTLKRMASRNFRGGIRELELLEIICWIESIDKLIKAEEAAEQEEAAEREAMVWREGDWTGKERQREWLFIKSFDKDEPALPEWPESSPDQQMPTDFLKAFQDGVRLVKLHNACVAKSKRKFDVIKTYHTDVSKPYRVAENLKFWAKAGEIRWETKIEIPALDIAQEKDEETWRIFDAAIFKWCQGVRTELTEEWREEARNQKHRETKPPELRIDVASDDVDASGDLPKPGPVDSGIKDSFDRSEVQPPAPAKDLLSTMDLREKMASVSKQVRGGEDDKENAVPT
ncbi:hypothetical protein CKM354_001181400 [Cercospora kikuchii]|uniref:Uncharacterized protein n=2 Tax=Cercospora kikuchii TaxID=84275 RepID=A0A9P3FL64_9PEZI|nr:uncharacterized protein CKM354_001181400 [Cercospora kikuchii]GIZ48764.1 hypothetical protein CKM354_001181400 [Cercospora kikuchii]